MPSKPYFQKNIEDKIVDVILAELHSESQFAEENAIREYIQAPKSEYENSLLNGVSNGIFLATIIGDEFAYKIKPPIQSEIDDIIAVAQKNAENASDFIPTSPPQLKSKNYPNAHAAKMAGKRARKQEIVHATKQEQRRQEFEKSKLIPDTEQIKEAIIRDRTTRLSHALYWTSNSPKLKTQATMLTSSSSAKSQEKNEKDNAISV